MHIKYANKQEILEAFLQLWLSLDRYIVPGVDSLTKCSPEKIMADLDGASVAELKQIILKTRYEIQRCLSLSLYTTGTINKDNKKILKPFMPVKKKCVK